MLKFIFLKNFGILLTSLIFVGCAAKSPKRTDGPKGSEYGPSASVFSSDFELGANFGAGFQASDTDENSFLLGLDLDIRPDELFGVRLQYLQGVDQPRPSLVSAQPLVFAGFSNARPYLSFGPGVAYVKNANDRQLRFLLAGATGVDILLTDKIGLGLFYQYNLIFDSPDFHAVAGRFFYSF